MIRFSIVDVWICQINVETQRASDSWQVMSNRRTRNVALIHIFIRLLLDWHRKFQMQFSCSGGAQSLDPSDVHTTDKTLDLPRTLLLFFRDQVRRLSPGADPRPATPQSNRNPQSEEESSVLLIPTESELSPRPRRKEWRKRRAGGAIVAPGSCCCCCC